LERKISTSTGQAETYAMVSLVKEVVWQHLLLSELGLPQLKPTTLFTDNHGVLKQSTKAINHCSAKHYRISQAYIRNQASEGVIEVKDIDTNDNETDALTKALHQAPFQRHMDKIMGPQIP
jgi:hypothetical protein